MWPRLIYFFIIVAIFCQQRSFAATNAYTHIFYYGWFPDEFTNQPDDCFKPFPTSGAGQCPAGCTNTHRHLGLSAKDIGAVFWPNIADPTALTPKYDSFNGTTIDLHGTQIASAGARSPIISYGGANGLPDISTVIKMGNKFGPKGLRASFAIRNYNNRSATSVSNDMLALALGGSPAIPVATQYRVKINTKYDSSNLPRPVFYIFAPLSSPAYWASIFLPPAHFRATNRFVVLSGTTSLSFVRDNGFDGYYNYTPATTHDTAYYSQLTTDGMNNMYLFSAGVSPGYNTKRTKNDGCLERNVSRFRTQLGNAAAARPHFISIISFNEWGEGTQIEPARTLATGKSGVCVAGKCDPLTCTGSDPGDCSYEYLAYIGDATNPTSATVYLNIANAKVGANKWSPQQAAVVSP